VPLQIVTLPEHPPDAARSYVGCLRDGRFAFLVGRAAPDWSNLENLNALPLNAEAEVQFRTNMRRRPTLFHQGIHGPVYSRQLNLRERHDRYATFRKSTVWALMPTLRRFLTAPKIAARLSILGLPLGDSIR